MRACRSRRRRARWGSWWGARCGADLFASDQAVDRLGDVVFVDDDRFDALPPVAVSFGAASKVAEEVKVELEGELTAIGTLDLACVEMAPARRRFRLAFQLREAAPAGPRITTPPPSVTLKGKRVDEAREAIARGFGKGRPDVAPREVKDLVRELERLLGARASWTTELSRALFDALAPEHRARRRSADHERVYWLLAGYCGRPGFGDPLDAQRVPAIAALFSEKVLFPQEARNWQQFWIAWRRLAGGLDEARQVAVRDAIDPLLAPAEARLKKPKGWKAEAPDDLLELAASLERVPTARRSELGGWILERTWTSRDPLLWAALGRIGARVPARPPACTTCVSSPWPRAVDRSPAPREMGRPPHRAAGRGAARAGDRRPGAGHLRARAARGGAAARRRGRERGSGAAGSGVRAGSGGGAGRLLRRIALVGCG